MNQIRILSRVPRSLSRLTRLVDVYPVGEEKNSQKKRGKNGRVGKPS